MPDNVNMGDTGMSDELYQKLRQDIMDVDLPKPLDESIRNGSMTLKQLHDALIERTKSGEGINVLDDSLIRLWISPYITLLTARANRTTQKRREAFERGWNAHPGAMEDTEDRL